MPDNKLIEGILFLKVADFGIKIIFQKNYKFIIDNYISQFSLFKKYVVDYLKDNDVSVTIYINKKHQEPSYIRKEDIYYIKFVNKISYAIYNTSYNISVPQLLILIQIALENVIKHTAGCFFLHSSGIQIRNEACLFLGDSSSGKSTITGLFNQKNITPFCDDISIIRKIKNKYHCFSASMFENKRYDSTINKGMKLKRIFILQKGDYFKNDQIQYLENKEFLLNFLSSQVKNVSKVIKINDIRGFLEANKNIFYLLIFPKKPLSTEQKSVMFNY